jgi:ABC-type lipoprotein export system ATPase subunit
MKEQGKIIIAITHDDHYFDAADRVIKMDMGEIETVLRVFAPQPHRRKRGIVLAGLGIWSDKMLMPGIVAD